MAAPANPSRPAALPRLERPPTFEEARGWPRTLQARVEPSFIDSMGHMNVSRYVHLFDLATWDFFARAGVDPQYVRDEQAGMFAVEQHLRYLGELREGDALEVRSRLLAVREKSIDLVNVMIDPVRERLVAVAEVVGVHIDLRTRRALAFPPPVAAAMQRLLAVADGGTG